MKLDARAIYMAAGAYEAELQEVCQEALEGCSAAAPNWEVSRAVERALKAAARRLTGKLAEVIVNSFDAKNICSPIYWDNIITLTLLMNDKRDDSSVKVSTLSVDSHSRKDSISLSSIRTHHAAPSGKSASA